jgi:glycogen phosphorylase
MAINGENTDEITRFQNAFKPDVLTRGFARRFAACKQPKLVLHDPARLRRIRANIERPVPLIIAGMSIARRCGALGGI